ncbi:zinc metallochaperone AztD [Saccharopolyspora sp. NFXS83]|uniref:zinc metallochaperone AztD n=1 Tax=Saccharopolyspora sp. NFXS83 TaxID=2993560 RepID=UPI00224AC09F|nr:zinc metallochaperone AztD [Saccharopolyspora sp. NFXS83]MCX2731870.1 zinc metallochaperone AztD [Saccharopolyspora sp. NFXS83]
MPTTRTAVKTGVALATAALALSACASPEPKPQAAPAGPAVPEPVVATYDGGIWVLDGRTLQVAADIPLDGFNRLNPAGDDEHVVVSTSDGFQLLDAAHPALTDVTFPGAKPGHVVRHAGRTVLFSDGTGEVTSFDPNDLGDGKPATEQHKTAEPHHGVAVELAGGELLTTLGNEDERVGIVVLDENGKEIARNEDCPGVHGEAAAQGDAIVVGCENGAVVYRDGTITKITSPAEYGRIGNQAGSEHSPVVLGDYKVDEDAELERPEQISLIDTANGSLRLVDLGTSYTFRSLARGPQGEALVLGTDGGLRVIDPAGGRVVNTIPVTGSWQEPLEWQQPRPALFVRGGTAYVTDPNRKEIHAIDLATGEKTATGTLPAAPNELSGVVS